MLLEHDFERVLITELGQEPAAHEEDISINKAEDIVTNCQGATEVENVRTENGQNQEVSNNTVAEISPGEQIPLGLTVPELAPISGNNNAANEVGGSAHGSIDDDRLDSPSLQLAETSEMFLPHRFEVSPEGSDDHIMQDGTGLDELMLDADNGDIDIGGDRLAREPQLSSNVLNVSNEDASPKAAVSRITPSTPKGKEVTPKASVFKKTVIPSSSPLASLDEIFLTATSQREIQSQKSVTGSAGMRSLKRGVVQKDLEYEEAMRRFDDPSSDSEDFGNIHGTISKSLKSPNKSNTAQSKNFLVLPKPITSTTPTKNVRRSSRQRRSSQPFAIPEGSQIIRVDSSPMPEEKYADDSADEDWGSVPRGRGSSLARNRQVSRGKGKKSK